MQLRHPDSPNSDLRSVALRLLRRAAALSDRLGRRLRIMEVCGTHTAAITRGGLRDLFAPAIEFRSGPGCPVCVTADGDMGAVLELALMPGVIVASPGDLIRVPMPSGAGSLQTAAAAGIADVRVILSPVRAVELAAANPGLEVVLLALGFETTSPTTAAVVLRAAGGEIGNFSILALHKLMPPALRAVLGGGGHRVLIDGLFLPGHVSVVTGRRAFDFVACYSGTPAVVAGFEPADVLLGLASLLRQLETASPEVANAYPRAVNEEGNRAAQQLAARVFCPCSSEWRGFGAIESSGLAVRDEYRSFDARQRFGLPADFAVPERVPGCRCGDVVAGRIDPPGCSLFGAACVPQRPHGPCMVSSEGACQIALASEEKIAWPNSEMGSGWGPRLGFGLGPGAQI